MDAGSLEGVIIGLDTLDMRDEEEGEIQGGP